MPNESAILDLLEPEQRRYLRERAKACNCSVAAVLRDIIAALVANAPTPDGGEKPGKAPGTSYRLPHDPKSIMDLAGIISDPEVTAENIDDYLYG